MIKKTLSLLDQWRSKKGGVILAFHEISGPALERQLCQVSERYQFISLSEFVERIKTGKSTQGLAAITFDDGLSDQIETAVKIGSDKKWPMIFFLPTRHLDTKHPYWFQELGVFMENRKNNFLPLNGKMFHLDAKGVDELHRYFYSLFTLEEIEMQLRKVRKWSSGQEGYKELPAFPKPVAWNRVRELANNELFSFGSHTVNHLPMNFLKVSELNFEMEQSASRIEAETGKKAVHFCYPFGSRELIGSLAVKMAEQRFHSAVTLVRGRCNSQSNPWDLPRMAIYEKDSEARMALKLALL